MTSPVTALARVQLGFKDTEQERHVGFFFV
jgi:hypothetical protein